MPGKFQNIYRIPSARLRNWDYGSNAIYFVTICTQNREHYFGEITDGQMNLSDTGKMANRFWFEIPEHFPFVQLGEFVVMPNHVHGIIIIDKPINLGNNDFVEMGGDVDCAIGDVADGNGAMIDARDCAIVETQNFASLPPNQPPIPPPNPNPPQNPSNPPTNLQNRGNIFGPQSQNLASIIRGYKIGVTKFARNSNIPFAWQSRFHDHIIRNHESFVRISDYIIHNPENWREDKFY